MAALKYNIIMRTHRSILVLLMSSTIFTWLGCKIPHYTLKELPEKRIHIGWGGGFAGTNTAYILVENGQVFHKPDFEQDTIEMNKISRKGAKKLVKKGRKILEKASTFNHPGNMYYFLEMPVDRSNSKRITWGDINNPVDTTWKEFYTDLRKKLIALEAKKVKNVKK